MRLKVKINIDWNNNDALRLIFITNKTSSAFNSVANPASFALY